MLIGYEIPLMMRINEEDAPDMRINLAQVLKMDYIGALVGALLWTFLLVRYLSIDRISFVVGLVTMVSAILCWFLYRTRLARPRARLIEIGGGVVLVTVGLILGRSLTVKAEQFLYRDPVITSITSPFQHIILTKNRIGNVRCYINGHLQFNEADEHIYHENLVQPAMHLADRREKLRDVTTPLPGAHALKPGSAAKPLLPRLRQLEKDLTNHKEAKMLQAEAAQAASLIKTIESAKDPVELHSLN